MTDTVSAVFTGKSAVGAAGPQIPTSGLFGSGGQFSAAQTLQTTSALSTGVGAFSTFQAGAAQQQSFGLQATSQDLQADVIKLNATERSNDLKRQLLIDIGASTASAAARGLDVGSGTPRDIIEQSISSVKTDVAKIEAGGEISAAGSRTAAARSRASGASAKLNASLRATQSIVGFGLSRVL